MEPIPVVEMVVGAVENNMKKNFKSFLIEKQTSFYTLYYTQFPSEEVEKMRDGKGKEKKLEIEQIKYKNLLTDFLRMNSAIN